MEYRKPPHSKKKNNKHNVGHAVLRGWSLVFYGTKLAVDKADVVSVPLMPMNTLSTSTNQPIIINTTKSSNAKGNNRKQQQQQQQKTAQTNPPNGRKNGKVNGKNETRKNWKQRLTTTQRPYTGKDRINDNINSMMAFMNKTLTATTTTTMRPMNKFPSNNVDAKNADKSMYGKTPIKAPKQIKEIVAGSHTTLNTTIVPNVASHVAFLDGIIVHQTTASPFDAQVDFIDSFPYTSNPNLPKYFQHYEKIQEFYPEFHPYVVPKAASSGGSVMKPSRDGSKNNHFASTSNQQAAASSSSSDEDSRSSMERPASRTNSATIIASNAGKG